MIIVNTLNRVLRSLGLLCCLQIGVWAANTDEAILGRLLEAEADFKVGKYATAHESYIGIVGTVSKDSPLRVAAWRGALLSSSNGDALQGLLKRLLKNETEEAQLKTFPVLRELRRTDERIDNLLIESIGGSDASVGVMLVELVSARNAIDVLPRLIEGFSGFDDQVKGAIIEVFARGSGSEVIGFLMELVFDSEKWSELATDSLVAMSDPSVDEFLLQNFIGDETVSASRKALAIDLLRKRGAVAYKGDFFRMLVGSESSVRSEIIHALRDWGEAGDLDTILKVMGQSNENALRGALSRLFVLLAQAQVKDDAIAIAALDEALSSADSSLKATLVKMKEAISRQSE